MKHRQSQAQAAQLALVGGARWCLVANRVEAVIYRDHAGKPLEFIERLSNPTGKLTETQLDSDRPGRSFASARGTAVRHGLDQRHIHHEQAAIDFATRIGEFLGKSAREERFDRLVIVAEPHFLGLVRKALPEAVSPLVEREVPREFHEGSDAELAEYLRTKLGAA